MTERAGAPAPPCPDDADCDGVLDDFDNCAEIQNAEQADTDAPDPRLADTMAYYGLDEVSGSLARDSAGGHDATLDGGVTRIADGRRGHALRLDGVDDAAVATVPMDGATAASLEAWVRTSVADQPSQYIVSIPQSSAGTNGFDLGVSWAEVRACLFTDATGGCITAQRSYADGDYHHMAATYDGGSLRLYWDGAQVSSTEATGSLVTDAGELSIGRFGTAGYDFSGDIDEVAVYARALTADEIAGHATLPLPDEIGDACDPCPLSIDPACEPLTCRDDDGDGYGIRGASKCSGEPAEAGAPADRAVFSLFDCDDGDPARHPGATDVCDSRDNDCDGRLDEDCAGPPQVTTYRYNAFNQLLDLTDPAGTTTFTWDANGNQTSKATPDGTTTYVWDARDRLVEIGLPDGTAARYGYDTGNLRVSMDDADGERRILLDDVEEHGDVDEATDALSARFDHDPTRIDALLAQDDRQGHAAMLTDALGSVYGLANDVAEVRTRYGYDVYGARSAMLEEIVTRWGFDGRPTGRTVLPYHRARWMDPRLGLFTSVDPLLTALFDVAPAAHLSNGYAALGGGPSNRRDPSGLLSVIECATEAGFAWGALSFLDLATAEVAEFFLFRIIFVL